MLAELVHKVHSLYGIASVDAVEMAAAIVGATCVLTDAMCIDPKEADAGVAHVMEDAVENALPGPDGSEGVLSLHRRQPMSSRMVFLRQYPSRSLLASETAWVMRCS